MASGFCALCNIFQKVKLKAKIASMLKSPKTRSNRSAHLLSRYWIKRGRHIHDEMYRCQEVSPTVEGQEARSVHQLVQVPWSNETYLSLARVEPRPVECPAAITLYGALSAQRPMLSSLAGAADSLVPELVDTRSSNKEALQGTLTNQVRHIRPMRCHSSSGSTSL